MTANVDAVDLPYLGGSRWLRTRLVAISVSAGADCMLPSLSFLQDEAGLRGLDRMITFFRGWAA